MTTTVRIRPKLVCAIAVLASVFTVGLTDRFNSAYAANNPPPPGSGIVDANGTISISNDGWSIMSDSRYETRELGVFFFYETARDAFTRAEVYNLRREHQYGGYPVYWAGHATNEESLNYLKSIIESNAPEMNRLGDRAAFALALHDDARVESLLTELIKKPVAESIRNRAICWLG